MDAAVSPKATPFGEEAGARLTFRSAQTWLRSSLQGCAACLCIVKYFECSSSEGGSAKLAYRTPQPTAIPHFHL